MSRVSQRRAEIDRKTSETQIEMVLELDGRGLYQGRLEAGFLGHMLELLSRHAALDLRIEASGDLRVDDHHLTEDLGIVLGQALDRALGERKGISRYGQALQPMDEVLVAVALDLGGRFAYCSNYQPVRERVGDLSTELVDHFFQSVAVQARMNLHFHFLNPGCNEHHRVEALFKGFARSLRMAAAPDPAFAGRVPSTKGRL